jgi:SsrA-binding protein
MAHILENRKARFDYEIIDTFEAGIKLVGSEVKSLKAGRASIVGSYVKIIDNEAYILGMKIDEYQKGNVPDGVDKNRTRKLLLKKTELRKLIKLTEEKGLTIVPLSLYLKNRLGNKTGRPTSPVGRWIKISIGVGKGKKKADKRETLKKRAVERDVRREYSIR